MLVYWFSRAFRTKKPFIYVIFLKIKWLVKHHRDFTVCLVLMFLLTRVAVFTSCGCWCGWVYSDLHYVYRQVLLNWSSLKSSTARVENEQCCYKYVSLILFFFLFSCKLFNVMKDRHPTPCNRQVLSPFTLSTHLALPESRIPWTLRYNHSTASPMWNNVYWKPLVSTLLSSTLPAWPLRVHSSCLSKITKYLTVAFMSKGAGL